MKQLKEIAALCKSWDDFKSSLGPLDDLEKGRLFEELVKHFLLLDPEYATVLEKVWLLSEVPTAVRKKRIFAVEMFRIK